MFEYEDSAIVAGMYILTIYRRSDNRIAKEISFKPISEGIISLYKKLKGTARIAAIHGFIQELVCDIPECYKANIKPLSDIGKSITYVETDKLP